GDPGEEVGTPPARVGVVVLRGHSRPDHPGYAGRGYRDGAGRAEGSEVVGPTGAGVHALGRVCAPGDHDAPAVRPVVDHETRYDGVDGSRRGCRREELLYPRRRG